MARKDPRQPFRTYYQWVGLILFGVALGGGIRLATGKTRSANPPEPKEPSSSISLPAPNDSSASESTSRHRTAGRASATTHSLTAAQAAMVLENPGRFRPDLLQLMATEEPPPQAPVVAACAELFGWDEARAGQVNSLLYDLSQNLRQHAHEAATLGMEEPGVIEVSFPGLNRAHAAEIGKLRRQFQEITGTGDFKRLEGLGFFEGLAAGITAELQMTVRLIPSGPWSSNGSARFDVSVGKPGFNGKSVEMEVHRNTDLSQDALIRHLPAMVMLPPVDWSHEFERAMAAEFPESP